MLLLVAVPACSSPPGPPPVSRVLDARDVRAYARHLKSSKSPKQRRRLRQTALVKGAQVKTILLALGKL